MADEYEVHSSCRSCGADVIFVPSAKTGKSMILDAKPKKGIVVMGTLQGHPAGLPVKVDQVPRSGVGLVVDVYTDHHATCPKAKDWQGRTRNNPPVRTIEPGAAL